MSKNKKNLKKKYGDILSYFSVPHVPDKGSGSKKLSNSELDKQFKKMDEMDSKKGE